MYCPGDTLQMIVQRHFGLEIETSQFAQAN
jgi:hypothetical protein